MPTSTRSTKSSPEEDEAEAFRLWFVRRKTEWLNFKAQEGNWFDFCEYLAAREMFLKENKNG